MAHAIPSTKEENGTQTERRIIERHLLTRSSRPPTIANMLLPKNICLFPHTHTHTYTYTYVSEKAINRILLPKQEKNDHLPISILNFLSLPAKLPIRKEIQFIFLCLPQSAFGIRHRVVYFNYIYLYCVCVCVRFLSMRFA